MKLTLALGALTLPLFILPSLAAAWLAVSWTTAGRRYAFARRSR